MGKKFLFLCLFGSSVLLTNFVCAAGLEVPSWKEWAPPTSTVQAADIVAFQNKLPVEARKSFDNASPTTQRLSVAMMLGLKASNGGTLPADGYYTAFKLANKAAMGFYFDKTVKQSRY